MEFDLNVSHNTDDGYLDIRHWVDEGLDDILTDLMNKYLATQMAIELFRADKPDAQDAKKMESYYKQALEIVETKGND
jgi:hypothetical protein